MYSLKFPARGVPTFRQGGVGGKPPPPTSIAGSATVQSHYGGSMLFNLKQISNITSHVISMLLKYQRCETTENHIFIV